MVHKQEEPPYYITTEKLTSSRWWVKNKVFFENVGNVIMVVVFVVGFGVPESSCVVIIVIEIVYVVYLFLLVPWIKIRYKVFNVIGNMLFVGVLGCLLAQINQINKDSIDSNQLTAYHTAYTAFIIILCTLFIISNLT
jgi:hypothetical protein